MKTPNQRDSDSEAACKDSKSEETNRFSQTPSNADIKKVHSHRDEKSGLLVTQVHDSNSPTAIYIVGEKDKSQIPHPMEKVLLLVGATGVGKGTLVNAIGNFLYGIQWKDERFTVTPNIQQNQALSQTSQISVYKFVHQRKFQIPYSVTVIDTPGFGDTGGLQKDEDISGQLKHLLSGDFKFLDALVLVVKANDARANSVQKYLLHTVQQHFGKDIQNNIFVVATHADSSRVRALEGLKASSFPFTKELVFPVNNVVLYAPTTSEDEDEAEMNRAIWDRNIKTYMKMFDALQSMTPVSLDQTRIALEEWECLTIVLKTLKEELRRGVLESLQLKDQEKLVTGDNSSAARQVRKVEMKAVPIEQNVLSIICAKQAFNCKNCNRTCQFPIRLLPFNLHQIMKPRCAVIKNNLCEACKAASGEHKKCYSEDHIFEGHRYVVMSETTTQNCEDVDRQYNSPNLSQKIHQIITQRQFENIRLLRDMKERLERLQEVSLSNSHVTLTGYIKVMIEEETEEPTENHDEVLAALRDLHRKAQHLMKEPSVSDEVLLTL